MDSFSRFHRKVVAFLAFTFLAVAGWYSLVIPSGEGVDETPHFAYVRYVKEQKALPVQPTEPGDVKVWMGHHPPLYYVLGSLAISWIDVSDFEQVLRPNPHFVWSENNGSNGWNVMLHFGQDAFPWRGAILALHVMRCVSVALGATAVLAVYSTTRYLLPEHRWAPLGAASLVAFNPSFVFMSSTVHHDVLLVAIFSLGLWWAVRATLRPLRKPDLWIGGLLAGAAGLTKASGIGLVVVMGLALLLNAWPSRDWRRAGGQLAHLVGVALLVCGWWYVRNQILYGDPLGWERFLSVHRHMVRTGSYGWNEFWYGFIGQLARTFWGAFGYMNITFPETTKYLWWATGIALLGLCILIARRIGSFRVTSTFFAWVVAMVALLLVFVSFVRFSIATVGAGHGRYLFPVAPAIGSLLVAGFNGFGNWRHERSISVLLALGMLVYAVWAPLTYALPKYASPAIASVKESEKAHASDWIFGDTVKLVAYDVEPGVAIPDAWLAVRFYWQALGSADNRPDVHAYARLVDEVGQVLHTSQFWPAESTTPAVWAPGEVIVSHQVLHVPAEGHSGQLYLEVALTSGRDGPALPATQGNGKADTAPAARLGPILAVGQVVEVAHEMVPNQRNEIFGPVALAGYELPKDPVQPGQAMVVQLYWHVLETPVQDYTTFVHVLNGQGELVAQFDRPPGGGTSPTTSWRPGQTLLDTYPIPIPEGLRTGDYVVRVGLYTWPSLEREPVSLDGVPAGDTALLGVVRVP